MEVRHDVLEKRAVGVGRWFLAAGAAAAVQMTVVVGVDGATLPGYSPYRNWISQLALGDRGWLGVGNLALCGGWLFAYAIGLRRSLRPSRTARWAVRLVRVSAAAFVLIAVIPIDPGLGYPPGDAAVHTARGYLHQGVAVVLFAAGTGASLLLGRCVGRPGAALGVVVVMSVAFVVACGLATLDVVGLLTGTPSGLFERIAMFAGLWWIAGVGLALLRSPG
jgi:hypothetical membrane protein